LNKVILSYKGFIPLCRKYAAIMQQRGLFFSIFDNNCHFLSQNVPNSDSLSNWYNSLWKKTICSIVAWVQQICSSMQQQLFFGYIKK